MEDSRWRGIAVYRFILRDQMKRILFLRKRCSDNDEWLTRSKGFVSKGQLTAGHITIRIVCRGPHRLNYSILSVKVCTYYQAELLRINPWRLGMKVDVAAHQKENRICDGQPRSFLRFKPGTSLIRNRNTVQSTATLHTTSSCMRSCCDQSVSGQKLLTM